MALTAALVPAALAGTAVLLVSRAPTTGRLRALDGRHLASGRRVGTCLDASRWTRVGAPGPGFGGRAQRSGEQRARVAALAGACVAVVVGGLAAGPVLAVLAGGAALVAAQTVRVRRRRAQRERELSGLGEALGVLAGELRAGRPPGTALDIAAGVAVGASRAALRAAARAGPLGADPAAVLRAEASGAAAPDVLLGLATCWQVCAGTGTSLARAVTVLSDAVAAQQGQRREIEAELAGPRATSALLSVLPLAGIGLAAALGAHPLHVLLHTPLGVACLFGALVLDALGLWWTALIVRGAGGGA